jgi:hypothetical protein
MNFPTALPAPATIELVERRIAEAGVSFGV